MRHHPRSAAPSSQASNVFGALSFVISSTQVAMTTVAMNSTQQARLQGEVQTELERREWAEPGGESLEEQMLILQTTSWPNMLLFLSRTVVTGVS